MLTNDNLPTPVKAVALENTKRPTTVADCRATVVDGIKQAIKDFPGKTKTGLYLAADREATTYHVTVRYGRRIVNWLEGIGDEYPDEDGKILIRKWSVAIAKEQVVPMLEALKEGINRGDLDTELWDLYLTMIPPPEKKAA